MVTNIPNPPSENLDPWFNAREAFDQAVRQRLNNELASAVASPHIGRLIAVLDGQPVPELSDGDLVVRYQPPGNTYYKDFSGDVLAGPPSGLTQMLEGSATVVELAGAQGGKALSMAASTPTAYAISASLGDPYMNESEVLVRWRTAATNDHGLSVWMNLDPVTDSSYRASYNHISGVGRARVTIRKDGVNLNTPETAISMFPVNTWCYTRVRSGGDRYRVKHWMDGVMEPAGWQVQPQDARVPAGAVAPIGKGGAAATFYVDRVVLVTGGRTAVMP